MTEPNWFLHYGKGRFAEVIVLGKTVYVRRGNHFTFGQERIHQFKSVREAQSAAKSTCARIVREGYRRKRSWIFEPTLFDFDLLRTELVEATRGALAKTLARDATTNAFALVSDGSRMTISFAARAFPSLKDAEDDELWNPSEWPWPSADLECAYRLILSHNRGGLSRVEWDDYREGFDRTVLEAIEVLRDEGVFGGEKALEKTVLLYVLTDSSYLKGSVARLNKPTLTARFRGWLARWGGKHP
jgi:hypothetical protein